MTEEAELLELMRAAPDDEGPRLVYADWLLARGDARGELIVSISASAPAGWPGPVRSPS